MWTDNTLKIINDNDTYIGADGTQYPHNWPKNDIPGLFAVTTVAQPTDPTVTVTGFIIQDINGVYTQVWQTVPVALSAAQAAQIATLNAACQATILGGYTSSATGTTYTYPNQITDQMNMAASVAKSLLPSTPSNTVFPFMAKDSGGAWAFRAHTIAQIQQVGQDAYAFVLTQVTKFNTLSAEVAAAQTVQAVQAITW